jgi:HEAT repeat protein
MKRLVMLGLLFAATVVHAQFDALRTLQPDQGQEVRRAVEAEIFNSTLEELPALEKELLAIFKDSGTSLEGRQYICRMLRFCASESCIPVLAPKLTDKSLSAFVRVVFQGLESPAADEALIGALSKAGNTQIKIGIIGTLGQRGSSASVKAIAPHLKSLNTDVQLAAIVALGNIGGMDSIKVLARAKVRPVHATAWKRAQVQSAGTLESDYALKVFHQYQNDDNHGIRIAVFIGMAQVAPEKALPGVIDALDSDDPAMRNAAIGLLASLPEKPLIDALPDCFPEKQVLLIETFASRKTVQAEAAVLALTESDHEAVRDEAFQALERIGGAASVPKLVNSMQSNATAYDTLCALKAGEADDALVEVLGATADDRQKAKLVECLAARRNSEVLPVFVELAKEEWSRSSAAAISGLANLVSEDDFNVYVDILFEAGNTKQILATEQSIAAAAQRLADTEACAQPLAAAYPKAKGEAQYAIIRALGSIGGETAREILMKGLTSPDAGTKDAAVRGLCNWPNAKVADALMDLAKNSDNEKNQVLALRGYIRLANGLDEERDVMPMCRQVVEVTDRPDVLKSVIACAKRFKSMDTVDFLTPMLENPAVANEAGWAIYEISRGWRGDPVKIETLGKKIIESVTDDELKKRTQTHINEIMAGR